jgi:hypothetical protein
VIVLRCEFVLVIFRVIVSRSNSVNEKRGTRKDTG